MIDVSVVTVSWNAAATIERTLRSVREQTGVTLEHIVIDGASRDGTMEVVARYRDGLSHVVSERDAGLYDAMKGLAAARGRFVGFLNADDAFAGPHVLSRLLRGAEGLDAVYGDVLQVDQQDRPARLIRGRGWRPRDLRRGIMPPHPAFYATAESLRAIGGFDTSFRQAADFDLIARFMRRPGVRAAHVPGVVVNMRLGGVSTQGLAATRRSTSEILRSCRANGIEASRWSVMTRYPLKVREVVAGRALRLSPQKAAKI